MESEIRENTRTASASFLGFSIGDSSKWQENYVGYTNLKMNLGETFRVKTRFGASNYDASEEFFSSLGEKKNSEEQRLSRFAHADYSLGTAALTRVEQDVFGFGGSKVTLFQEFARVDPFFEDLKFSDKALRKQTKEDVFSKADRETSTYGVSLVQGSSGVTFSQSSISNISEGPASFYRENRFDSKAWFGLRDTFNEIFSSAGPTLANIVPSNVWVGYNEGSVRRNGFDITAGAITGLDAGASWLWGDTYAHLSAWRSLDESPQPVTNLSSRSLSDGGDFSIGVHKKTWSVSGYLSLTRLAYEDGLSNVKNTSIDGGVSFSYHLENWPSVTLAVEASSYDGTYTAWKGTEIGRYVKAGIALDFTKFLTKRNGQKLQFVYYARNDGFDSSWSTIKSHSLTLDHVFGAVMRTSWD
jgi:hypothetical protein